ncbi:MAG: sugar phosphate isomerase/epimerase family protein [Bryobacteraceae bacterium]|nr:sugar phosphate isomerase/epimerase family protein [Bryobacteraceae bacterium]
MPRKMTIHLTCGSIGVKADQLEAIGFAHHHGYEAVEPQPDYLATLSDSESMKLNDQLRAKRLVWGSAGLRVDFRGAAETFEEGMKLLPAHAKALQRSGVTRVGTWLRPTHERLTYRANFDQHVRRLSAIAAILGDHGMRFGLEYVGPKTSWSAQRFPFVHTMAETKELIAATGRKNIGFVLDSWHWYTAQESKADILTLKNDDVVSVDLNDAPKDTPVDRQMDLARELPCATGVIDVAAFLNALQEIGYDGPVRPEPFNAELRKLPRDQALAVTAEAMRKAFALILA